MWVAYPVSITRQEGNQLIRTQSSCQPKRQEFAVNLPLSCAHKQKSLPLPTGFSELAAQPWAGRVAGSVYFNSASTLCGCWLAWANMAVAACWTICDFDSWVLAMA